MVTAVSIPEWYKHFSDTPSQIDRLRELKQDGNRHVNTSHQPLSSMLPHVFVENPGQPGPNSTSRRAALISLILPALPELADAWPETLEAHR
jgi:hypothetical protein